MHSGKTTVATLLVRDHGYIRLRFADAIKNMLRVLGLDDEHLEGSLKETPTDLLCGLTPRKAMQTLGTEWGRKQIHPGFWVRATETQCNTLLDCGHRVVIDDVRFGNEAAMVRKAGGTLLRVVRYDDVLISELTHETEKHWSSIEVDGIICNRFDISNLTCQIQKIFEITICQDVV